MLQEIEESDVFLYYEMGGLCRNHIIQSKLCKSIIPSFVRVYLYAFSVIPARYEHVPIWRTHDRYRKQMKRGYSKLLYNQRNKDETIMSVIKRLFGEDLMFRLTRTQNRELSFRCITYKINTCID
jgi:hypothetical protein